ncbi:hypothetical protein [Motilibacter aurantiacus]|uniref:hypothetical protein n=1 Tax=Motilibacter aurantiacus TaxID=2714955 RepID=UPI00140721C5|nr:hypothetical protein [Motilibacter aurantiacus]NHC44387.1 hypothetical protein [Motilibacter aurantiacus]
MALGFLTALTAAVAFGVAALLQAMAARREQVTDAVDPRLLLRMLRHPEFVAALALNLAGFGLHFAALRLMPLFLAQAVIGSSVAVTALLSARLLKAPLNRQEYAAVAAVCAGLALLALGGGEEGEVTTSAAERAWLLAVVAGIVLAGALAGRASGTRGALLLGLVSGMGFAVVAVSGRVLPTFLPPDVLSDPATYSLLAGGTVAFLLYSAAMQRGSAITATGAMVLCQTAGPSLVGMALLGDAVRDGWLPVSLLGVVLAATGAVLLARFDPQALAAPAAR